MSVGRNSGGVQRDINVTPLIDVLLVLLIIFLVVMPIMMKMETLDVPPRLSEPNATPETAFFTVKVRADLSVVLNDGDKDVPIQAADMASILRPKLEAMRATTEKVVFVDFEDPVPWNQVATTMDTIRSLAADVNHDEIKVALRVKDDSPKL